MSKEAAAAISHELANNRAGLCARKVCGAPHEDMRHKHSSFLYCRPCARRINEACGEIVVERSFPS